MQKIATFPSLEQAHLCRMQLESSGIEAEVFDDATSNLMPMFIHAIGGVRVMVADEDVPAAKELLEAEFPEESLREGFVCPKCSSTNIDEKLQKKRSYGMSFLLLFLFAAPAPITVLEYKCLDCNHTWR